MNFDQKNYNKEIWHLFLALVTSVLFLGPFLVYFGVIPGPQSGCLSLVLAFSFDKPSQKLFIAFYIISE